MQEHWISDHVRGLQSLCSGPVLPSRKNALDALVAGWLANDSVVRILTGAPGAGKSWLWRMAVERSRQVRNDLRWAWCPHWPSARATDLMRGLLGAIEESGVSERMSLERMYVWAERRIREFHQDGLGLRIVIEESHHLERQGYESIRILGERLKHAGVNLSVLYVGRTPLLRKIRYVSGEPDPAGWHLAQISLPETQELLRWRGGQEKSWTRAEADWIHREALGNPRRIIRWADCIPETEKPEVPAIRPSQDDPRRGSTFSPSRETMLSEPLIPTRPPLTEAEGVIEVGYTGDGDFSLSDSETGNPSIAEYDQTEAPSSESNAEGPGHLGRYRIEAAESFAPYGLGSGRQEPKSGQYSE